MKGRNYHITTIDFKIFGNSIKTKTKRFRKSKKGELYSDLLAHYHMHVDPDQGVGKVIFQRIPCRCISVLNMSRKKWDTVNKVLPKQQPRFYHNKSCKHNKVFGKFNYCNILQVSSTPENNEDDLNDVKMNTLDSILIKITSEIKLI